MGEYHDFDIKSAEGQCVAGICHARGPNANLPAQWLIYIVVADVEESARKCEALGGAVIDGPRSMGAQKFCVIQNPAGAVAALFSGWAERAIPIREGKCEASPPRGVEPLSPA